jgi:malonyl-CoA decarboxylase
LGDEPLIFVEVALTDSIPSAIAPLLAPDRSELAPQAATTAVFYSISNAQRGLARVSFGNFLIKQVVEELQAELPQLKRFSTLSPVPGFRRFVERAEVPGLPEDFAALSSAEGAFADAEACEAWRVPLMRACARFLTDTRGGRGPVDPVARFHLGNGARLERVNWRGNVSPRGVAESFGIMVNYLYDPDSIEANHEGYQRTGAVARGEAVEALLESAPKGWKVRLRA